MSHLLTIKPAFLSALLGLPAKAVAQVTQKLDGLVKDPSPDGHSKKHLSHLPGKLHRLRSGDYRVIYTYDERYVSVLALRRREKDTYDEAPECENLGGLDSVAAEATPAPHVWAKPSKPVHESKPLPVPITEELLSALRVPAHLFKRLLAVRTEDELLDCPDVPDEVKLRVDQAVFETPLKLVLEQPDLVVPAASDLVRFREGDLLGFLLKLDPEQEAFVRKNLSGTGPSLLKGGPGTGKSTVAIYRVRELVRTLPRIPAEPRILFTTYTNALVAFTKQLLEQLLGDQAALVDVRTADSLVRAIVGGECDGEILGGNEATAAVAEAASRATFAGNALALEAQRQAVRRLSPDYLREEICRVIEGRALRSLEEYLAAPRPGRLVPFSSNQRKAVWAVRERLNETLLAGRRWTWERLRRRALEKVEAKPDRWLYDAVVVDEAQDLDPVVLRLLTTVCAQPSRLFVTADANQSIYGSGFSWKDVHESLRFQGGRTGTIRTNHRSTREIAEAARAYLRDGVLEEVEETTRYEHSGALPAVREVRTPEDEAKLLARFVREATRAERLPTSSAAVLVPSEKSGKSLAEALSTAGIPAEFMPGTKLDLRKPVVKVVTLKSAKGLEFPVVALAGFTGPHGDSHLRGAGDEGEEVRRRERRTYFVGMTRAMRALLVIRPEKTSNPLLGGFAGEHWNLG